VVVQLPFQKLQSSGKEGFANLATDSDYSYLTDHVNANRSAAFALTCCSDRIFSTTPKIIIQKSKLAS
jgi:hypothetical protein